MIELQVESAPVAKHEDVRRSWPTIWRSNWRPAPAPRRPRSCGSSRRRAARARRCEQWKDEIEEQDARGVPPGPDRCAIDAPTGGYVHHDAKSGVLLEVEGGNDELAKDIAMHVAAMKPKAATTAELDPALVDKERAILTEQARKEGKPENIIEKMIEGRMRNFYAEHVLAEQPFVKDDKQIGRQSRRRRRDEAREVHPLAAGRNGRRQTGRITGEFTALAKCPGLFLCSDAIAQC